MREIKFRAWYPENQIMSKPRSLDWMMFHPNSAFIEQNGMVWLQYTGLKDKNGVEIYEGDIVEWTDYTGEIVRDVYRVEYQAPTFMLLNTEHPEYVGGTIPMRDMHQFEVIGNIYENPELLGEQK